MAVAFPGRHSALLVAPQATVDRYNKDEELSGFAVVIGGQLAMPFEKMVLGVTGKDGGNPCHDRLHRGSRCHHQ
jgi:hypothetical protein